MNKTIGLVDRARNGLLAVGLCASLAGGSLGLAGHAEARVPEGATGEFAQHCAVYQRLFDEAERHVFTATTIDDKLAWQNLLSYWIEQWYADGCDQQFGAISVL